MQPFTRFRINEPKVIQETIEGESVIVNLVSGNYFSVDKVGAEIWENIEQGKSIDEILNHILCSYNGDPDNIENSIKKLIEEFVKEELVVPDSSGAIGSIKSSDTKGTIAHGQKKGFEAPVLKKYTDMQDLLLLDPIHEVDETGWPNIKQDMTGEE